MTDDWLRVIDDKNDCWGCLVFSAAFDIIDVLTLGPELQAVRLGYVILGEN
jgi:hypothetical protein